MLGFIYCLLGSSIATVGVVFSCLLGILKILKICVQESVNGVLSIVPQSRASMTYRTLNLIVGIVETIEQESRVDTLAAGGELNGRWDSGVYIVVVLT